MSNNPGQFNYDGSGFMSHQEQLDGRPMLSQSSSLSTQDTQSTGISSDYSSPMMMGHAQAAFHLQDPNLQGRMLSPASSQTPEWWPHNAMMPSLDTSISMMAELGLSQSAGATASPVTQEEYNPRRTSMASNPEIAEWQEKVRVERRKVQNRAAQRAYRERKDKAITDLRELLDKKESQYEALQADHKELRGEYERLLAAKQDASALSMTTTCAPSDLLAKDVKGASTNRPRLKHPGDD